MARITSGLLPCSCLQADGLSDWRSNLASYLTLDAPDGIRRRAARREAKEIGARPGKEDVLGTELGSQNFLLMMKAIHAIECLQGARNVYSHGLI